MGRSRTKRPVKAPEDVIWELAREIIVGHRPEPIVDYFESRAERLLARLLPDGLEGALQRLGQVLRREHDPAELGFDPLEPEMVVDGVLHLAEGRLAYHIRMKKWHSHVGF